MTRAAAVNAHASAAERAARGSACAGGSLDNTARMTAIAPPTPRRRSACGYSASNTANTADVMIINTKMHGRGAHSNHRQAHVMARRLTNGKQRAARVVQRRQAHNPSHSLPMYCILTPAHARSPLTAYNKENTRHTHHCRVLSTLRGNRSPCSHYNGMTLCNDGQWDSIQQLSDGVQRFRATCGQAGRHCSRHQALRAHAHTHTHTDGSTHECVIRMHGRESEATPWQDQARQDTAGRSCLQTLCDVLLIVPASRPVQASHTPRQHQ